MGYESIKNNIAANISYYRKRSKLTQAQLASKLNTKSTTVSTWERGASLPDAETLYKICTILGVSLVEIYGTDSVSDKDNFELSHYELDIIEKYRRLDDNDKHAVNTMIDSLLSTDKYQDKENSFITA